MSAKSFTARQGAYTRVNGRPPAETDCSAISSSARLPCTRWSSRLQIARGAVLLRLKGYGAPDVRISYERAMELSELVEDHEAFYATLWGLSSYFTVAGPGDLAHEVSDRAIATAALIGDPFRHAEACRRRGLMAFVAGEFQDAERFYAAAHELLATVPDRDAPLFGTRPNALLANNSAWVAWFMGRPVEAVESARRRGRARTGARRPLCARLRARGGGRGCAAFTEARACARDDGGMRHRERAAVFLVLGGVGQDLRRLGRRRPPGKPSTCRSMRAKRARRSASFRPRCNSIRTDSIRSSSRALRCREPPPATRADAGREPRPAGGIGAGPCVACTGLVAGRGRQGERHSKTGEHTVCRSPSIPSRTSSPT